MIVILLLLFVCGECRAMSPMRAAVKDEWRRREWWPAFLSRRRWERTRNRVCVCDARRESESRCFHMQMSCCYYSLFASFAICLFRGIYASGLNIKALMAPNTRSGSRVGGRLLSQHIGLCSLNFSREASRWLRDRVRVLQIIAIHSHST